MSATPVHVTNCTIPVQGDNSDAECRFSAVATQRIPSQEDVSCNQAVKAMAYKSSEATL